MELNDFVLNSMPYRWSRQACEYGFDCEYITIKYLNMFERMEITESIYEGVIEPYY